MKNILNIKGIFVQTSLVEYANNWINSRKTRDYSYTRGFNDCLDLLGLKEKESSDSAKKEDSELD